MNFRHCRAWILSLLAIASLSLTTLVSCTATVETPLRLGSIAWPGYELLYLARELGYYEDVALELVDFPSSTEIIRAYLNQDLDLVALTLDEILSLKVQSPDLKIILVADISEGGDVILGKPELDQLADLNGKRVGVESTALGAYVLTRALEIANLKTTDIEIVPLTISEHESAFRQDLVDAVVTFDPVRSLLLSQGAKLLFDSTQMPGEIVDLIAVRSSALTDQSHTLQALVDGWFKAYAYFQANPAAAAEIMAVRSGITPTEFLASLDLLHMPDLAENRQLLNPENGTLNKTARQLLAVMKTNKLIDSEPDMNTLFDPQIVEASSPN